jgi:peptide/nickel transport system substrate-binding protein
MSIKFLTLLALSFFLNLSSVMAQDQSDEPKRLVIGMSQYPSTFHPGIDSMMAKTYVHGFTRRPLTVYDQSWTKICMLCTELPSYENGRVKVEQRPDGTQGLAVTYTIHPDAKWGDGKAITTTDILFTWKVGKDSAVGISNFELYSKDIVNITAKDEKTFTVHTDKVTCDFDNMADFDVLPAHIEDSVYEKGAETYRTQTSYDTDITNKALYNGPYVVNDSETGVSITLKLNPEWWGEQQPYFDEIVLSTIENTNTLSAQLLTGQIDMISGELGLPMDQARALEKRLQRQGDQRFIFTYKPGLIYEHLDVNHNNPLFADVRVRQALLHGVNRDLISAQLFDGKQPVAHHNVHPLDTIYINDIPRYAYDLEKADQLLTEAGWVLGDDGKRRNASGELLSFAFQTTSGNKSRELVQQAIQADWAKLGIKATIKNEPPRVLFGETLQKRTYDGTVMYAWLSAPENVPKTTLHSNQIPSTDNGFAGQNYLGYKNPEMDRLIDELEIVCEADKRENLWRELQHLYASDLPALPLYFRADAYVIPQSIRGIEPTGHQFPSSLWAEHWTREN